MAKGDTKTNQYLDIAANGTRADLPTDTCCETRSQTLIREVAERIITEEETRARADQVLQNEIDEIKNSPDVVDIVPTYAALQQYDTQHLGDNDVIRVLADETHDGQSAYYRYNKQSDSFTFIGTVGDYYTKGQVDTLLDGKQDVLTAGENITIEDESGALVISATGGGSSYTAGDGIDITNSVISATNTGKAKVLTTADYNWNHTTETSDENNDMVALWLLPPGVYFAADGVRFAGSKSAVLANSPYSQYERFCGGIVSDTYTLANKQYRSILMIGKNNPTNQKGQVAVMLQVLPTTGALKDVFSVIDVLNEKSIQNTLTSTSSYLPLSAAQGKVLKDLVDSLAIRASGAPTTSTVGAVGTLYEDTTNGDLYICTDATNPYVWEEVGGSGGGIIELTSADYNYPENNPDRIGLWLLPDGTYKASTSVNIARNINSAASTWTSGGTYYISTTDTVNTALIITEAGSTILSKTNINTGSEINSYIIPPLVNTTGTSTTVAMSQNATTSMIYADPSTRRRVKIGNSGSTLADWSVGIGGASVSGEYSVAIGDAASATASNAVCVGGHYGNGGARAIGSVAIGTGAIATQQGQFDISTGYAAWGYNNSDYRLLTGLYDGQSNHDAATVAQGNKLMADAPTTTDAGVLGQLWTDTTNMHTYQLGSIDETDPSNPVYNWVQRW